MTLPRNPDVPAAVKTPDTYLYISTAPVSTGSPQPLNVLILAPMINSAAALTASPYSLTAGTEADLNSIKQYTSVSVVQQAFGRRSLAAQRFRAVLQAQPVGLNVYIAAIAEPTNSDFAGVATQLLTFAGTAVGSGEIKIRVRGYLHRIGVASGDSAATIATATHTGMGGSGGRTNPQCPDCPMVPGAIVSSVTVPLVFVHRGEIGNSKPIVVDIPPEITGIYVSPGIITVSGTGNAGVGSSSTFTLRCGSQSLTVSIPHNTNAADAATAIAAAINAATFPLAAEASTADVILKYRSGWAVHRIQIQSSEPVGGQTYTLEDRMNSTHGAIDTVATVPGTTAFTALQGSGTPTLTTVLANRAKGVACMEWAVSYNDSTSVGAIITHIEQYANGYYQHNQRAFFSSDEVLDTTGTGLKNAKQRLTDPSPVATSYWRYAFLQEQDPFCDLNDCAAELAADLCATPLPFNFDGHILAQGGDIPILPGRADTELDPSTTDTAMRAYYLTPAKDDNGRVKIIRGVTTWAASNTEWADFSYGRMFDDARYRLRSFLNERFAGKVLFTATAPRVDNAFTLSDVRDAVQEFLDSRDGITVDGAKSLGRFIVAELDPDDASYIRLAFRLRVPREAHVKSGVISSAPRVA